MERTFCVQCLPQKLMEKSQQITQRKNSVGFFCCFEFEMQIEQRTSLRDARRLVCLYGFKRKINWYIGRIECIEHELSIEFIRQQPGMVIEKSTHAIQNVFE